MVVAADRPAHHFPQAIVVRTVCGIAGQIHRVRGGEVVDADLVRPGTTDMKPMLVSTKARDAVAGLFRSLDDDQGASFERVALATLAA
jgi:hypothetical protein